MSRRIRDDFEGVVYAPGGVVLKAGDEIPEGIEVGAHLLNEEQKKPTPRTPAKK